MPMCLQEVHPTLVHYPLALVPAAFIADALGWLTGSRALMRAGAALMPVATGSAVAAGTAGLIAQQAVKAEGEAHDMLATHRTLNLGLVGVMAALTAWRLGREEPTPGYLLAGLAGMVVMSYSAYLGGKMVYEHGVGVRAAGGVLEDRAPEIRTDNLGEVAKMSGRHAVEGMRHAAEMARQGEIVPTLAHTLSTGR